MVSIAVRHKVENFDRWLSAYNAHASERVKHGQIKDNVYPSLDEGGEVLVVTEWESAEAFETFRKEANLEQVMKDAGVISAPDIAIFRSALD